MNQFISLAHQLILAAPVQQSTTITVTFDVKRVITWIIIGIVAGSLASLLVRGRGMHWGVALVVGLLGAIIGGFLFNLLKIGVSPALEDGITLKYIDILVAFIGAVILLILVGGLFFRRRGGYRRE